MNLRTGRNTMLSTSWTLVNCRGITFNLFMWDWVILVTWIITQTSKFTEFIWIANMLMFLSITNVQFVSLSSFSVSYVFNLLLADLKCYICQVESIVLSIISMLSSPNDESPANVDAAVTIMFPLMFASAGKFDPFV